MEAHKLTKLQNRILSSSSLHVILFFSRALRDASGSQVRELVGIGALHSETLTNELEMREMRMTLTRSRAYLREARE